MTENTRILAIESSCDETAAAVVAVGVLSSGSLREAEVPLPEDHRVEVRVVRSPDVVHRADHSRTEGPGSSSSTT
jgi:hypothetical protein